MSESNKEISPLPATKDYHSRLAEKITGFSFEKMPELREKIYFDRQKIIGEMGLPDSTLLKQNTIEYSQKLLESAKQNGVNVYSYDSLSEERKNQFAGLIASNSGWYDEELKGPVVADPETHNSLKLRELTHEIIHAVDFQTRALDSEISIEEAEYRAYIVSDISKEVLERGDETTINSIKSLFSDGRIAGSCFYHYVENSGQNSSDFFASLKEGDGKISWY